MVLEHENAISFIAYPISSAILIINNSFFSCFYLKH